MGRAGVVWLENHMLTRSTGMLLAREPHANKITRDQQDHQAEREKMKKRPYQACQSSHKDFQDAIGKTPVPTLVIRTAQPESGRVRNGIQ